MFSDKVIRDAKRNLKGKGSGKLANSLNYDLKVYPSGALELNFKSEDYAKFVDKGVKGKESSAKAPQSPYQYKNRMPPTKALDKWVVRKGLKAARDDKGRFIKRKSLVFLIARNIKLFGIRPSNFFTDAVNQGLKGLPKDFAKAYALDAAAFIRTVTKEM